MSAFYFIFWPYRCHYGNFIENTCQHFGATVKIPAYISVKSSVTLFTFLILISAATRGTLSQPHNETAFQHFITRRNDTLFNGDSLFRFISFNVPNLHLLEDHFLFTVQNNWTLPTSFEIRDAMQSVSDAGGTVIRIYCLRIQRSFEPEFVPKHLTGWRTYYEPAFLVMDTLLAYAHEYGIRLIIPFLEGPQWWGPKEEFARLHKGCHSFDSKEVREDYRHLVSYVLNRRNTITGIRYRNDKAILCWETGNEMPTSSSWLKEMAAYIKSIDPRHLLMDGNYGVRNAALDNKNIDIVSNHFYKKPAVWIKNDLRKISGQKAYLAGEWGWTREKCNDVIDQIQQSATANALIWSLRFRHRSGGFTWHKGQGLHWPGGFDRTELDNEKEILEAVRNAAFSIRKIPLPPLAPPAPPRLLPIDHPSCISWQGSSRANRYTIQRADASDTLIWLTVGDSIDETTVAYRPHFSDTTVETGRQYFYRCIGYGPGGISAPSNTVGPVTVNLRLLVDEFLPEEMLYKRQAGTRFTSDKSWRYKYDFHRRRGSRRSHIDYNINGAITRVRLYAFFPKRSRDFSVSVVNGNGQHVPLNLTKEEFPYCCANPKDRLRLPVLFSVDSIPTVSSYLRITFPGGGAQLGRCEIEYK